MSFLLSPKYNIFRSEKIHTDRLQHYLHHGIYFRFFERFEFEFLEIQNLGSIELEIQMSALAPTLLNLPFVCLIPFINKISYFEFIGKCLGNMNCLMHQACPFHEACMVELRNGSGKW
jgi:hypothetical protein